MALSALGVSPRSGLRGGCVSRTPTGSRARRRRPRGPAPGAEDPPGSSRCGWLPAGLRAGHMFCGKFALFPGGDLGAAVGSSTCVCPALNSPAAPRRGATAPPHTCHFRSRPARRPQRAPPAGVRASASVSAAAAAERGCALPTPERPLRAACLRLTARGPRGAWTATPARHRAPGSSASGLQRRTRTPGCPQRRGLTWALSSLRKTSDS